MNIEQQIIGVIGYGNFGKVICNNLFPKNNIILFSKNTRQEDLPQRIILVNNLEELVEKSDIIIPCVPIRNFEETIKIIAKKIKPQTTVIDVCSIKVYPVNVMKQYLQNTQIIASHPMFGPNSIKKRNGDLKQMNMVIWNISADHTFYEKIKSYFVSLTLHIVEITPEEHDKMSAHSQFFAMMVGQMVMQLQLASTPIDTPGAHALFDAMENTGKDKTIIEDMLTYNDYCKPLLEKMMKILEEFKH